MTTSMLAYVNLLLLAVVSLVYITYADPDSTGGARVHHVFISPVPEGSRDATLVRSAADAVETDWNCRVTVLHAPDDPPSLARALKKALTLNADGVSMPGDVDADLLLPIVTEAHRQGVPVTYHTSPSPEAQRRFVGMGAGFVGTDGESSGYMVAEAAVARLGIAPGSSVLLVGEVPEIRPGTRLQGCVSLLQAQGVNTEYLQVTPESVTTEKVPSHPELALRIEEGALPQFIFWESGPVGGLTALLYAERNVEDTYRIVSLNPIQEQLSIFESRYIGMQVIDRTFLACYLSLVQLQLTHRYGLQGIEIPVGGV